MYVVLFKRLWGGGVLFVRFWFCDVVVIWVILENF